MSDRDRVKFLYRFLLRSGDMLAARKVFLLLRSGAVTLGLSDPDWTAQLAIEQVLQPRTSRDGNWCRFRLDRQAV
jgi:hypothetical protein